MPNNYKRMKLFNLIKHWLKTKLFYAVQNIQIEKDRQEREYVISSMKSVGDDFSIRTDTIITGMKYMEIGAHFYCGRNAWLEAIGQYDDQFFHPKMVIGDNFKMQHNCHIGCINSIEIGNNVLLGSKVYITDHFHGKITAEDIDVPPIQRKLSSKPVKISDNVWIGDNVCILPGVTLGNNVIVGANAVVTHSFPANSVIAGCPAQIIKTLN